jgi:hypothetical protein
MAWRTKNAGAPVSIMPLNLTTRGNGIDDVTSKCAAVLPDTIGLQS